MEYGVQSRNYNNRQLIGRLVPYFKEYSSIFFLDLFCAALSTASEIILPIILRNLTNLAIEDISLITPRIIGTMAVFFVILKIIDMVAGYYMTMTGHMMGAKIETNMRRDLFTHLQKLSDSFYNENKVGQIMARITSDLFDITEFAHHCPEEYFIGALQMIFSFIILIRINVPLTIILFTLIPLMIYFSSRFRTNMRKSSKDQRNHIGELNADIEDNLLGIRVVKSFANEEIELEKFQKGNHKFLDIKGEFYQSMAGFMSVTKLFEGLMYLAVMSLGGVFMMRGSIRPGDLVAYIMYVSLLINTVRRIVNFTEQFQKGMTGMERFMEIMDEEVEIYNEEDAKTLEKVEGKIRFENVSFRYSPGGEDVLKNINLDISPGEKVALVGPSGGGKTTICNLIPRFYDVTEGSITVDGKDVRELTLESLRSNIGIVQQDVYLFSGTVYENIEYGKPGASKEAVMEAARLAGAYSFIQELPNGFDTYVGERGVKLSGGQKQRISIARVFLKNPDILILDEATSALDNKSERIIQESLEKLSEGRTTLTIAHRLTTIQNADKIIVLTPAGIIERGSHLELMEKEGVYYQLYTGGGNLNTMDLGLLAN
ncbi:MAG: ABC transporter ATP-binding protein [Gallicola sp.]|nr:ABC transporter ATP-binding protein [Gallicola sp.]